MHPTPPSADVCTPALAPFSQPQALTQCRFNTRRVTVKNLPAGILVCRALALVVLALPCGQKAVAMPAPQAADKLVHLSAAGPFTVGAGLVQLSDEPGTHWLGSIVEFFAPVPPQSGAVAQQQAQRESEQRDRGVLEQFKHRHPVLFNLTIAALTLLAGFYIGGGFGGGK